MDDQDDIQSITSLDWRIFHFLYISASPNIHGKLLYIHHHQRPKGQLIETMALIHEGKFITRLMGEPPCTYNCTLPNQFYAFDHKFPASAFFLVNQGAKKVSSTACHSGKL